MIPDEVIVPCLVWVFMEYFSLVPLLSFHHQLQNLHYFLCLNIAPYIPPMIIHVQLFSVSIYAQPDAVDITDQDCLITLFETIIVENLAC